MNKTLLIIKREFMTRVKKKSFIIMTVLTPILMGALMIVPGMLASMGDTSNKKIAVVDKTKLFVNKLQGNDKVSFEYITEQDFPAYKKAMKEKGVDAILVINQGIINNPKDATIYSPEDVSVEMSSKIESNLEELIKEEKMRTFNIQNLDAMLKQVKSSVNLNTIKLDENGMEKETNTMVIMGIAYIFGFLMYIFIFLFGSQVMRGVIEEKSNRVVEVIISSVKPIQLMMGKIIGVAAVGLLQFTIWILLSLAIFMGVKGYMMNSYSDKMPQQQAQITSVMSAQSGQQVSAENMEKIQDEFGDTAKIFNSISERIVPILFYFVIFFLGGYLLYSSLFAAVGSAVDNETETQQLMLPITIPIILALMIMMHTFQNPNSSISFWFSMIPLTSPIVMMARIPFEIPTWEVIMSIAILYATIFAVIWLSAKIYRTGILMYGKKTTFKEMIKWIKHS
ncbi:ABC transporter permease [uncultured Acetobacteroides sp.]|uniref:ABC transporter permease n=1 Tax=uncultured Acetobacteroides sp. TaxID=1760811 RepID=UPI0029F53FAD|nr:ABC transporter permease [uncultured Acetobacteroides sp.]